MDEQQILNQLNKLDEEVKPREKWVNLTKKELLNSQQQQTAATLISKAFAPLQRPALALAGIGVIAMLLSGGIFYSPQLVEVNEPMPEINFQKEAQQQQLAASVEKLNESLNQINGKLATLENSKDIREVIPKLAAIRATAQQGIEITNTQTLAAMGETEISKNLESIVERTNKMSSSSAKILINNVEANKEFLTSEEQGHLEKAKEAYKEGNYNDVLIHLRPFLQ